MAPAVVHINKRKRCHKYEEPFPHPNPKIAFLDKTVLVFSVIYPLTTLPQIIQIFVNKSAGDISIITWSSYLVCTIPFLMYSIVHKSKPLVINYSLWTLMTAIMVVGAIIY